MITPRNWRKFQHYKRRNPPWIRLYRQLLDDFNFARLPLASKALAPMLWLIASEYEGGKIDAPLDQVAFRLRISMTDLIDALIPLVQLKFFEVDDAVASAMLAACKQGATPETETEAETEGEKDRTVIVETDVTDQTDDQMLATRKHVASKALADDWPSDYRDQFWSAYPHKVGKSAAIKRLERARKEGIGFAGLMRGLHGYTTTKPPDRPWCNPLTWLNQGRWDDEPAPQAQQQLTEFQRGRNETKDILDDLDRYATGSGGGGEADTRLLPGNSSKRSA